MALDEMYKDINKNKKSRKRGKKFMLIQFKDIMQINNS